MVGSVFHVSPTVIFQILLILLTRGIEGDDIGLATSNDDINVADNRRNHAPVQTAVDCSIRCRITIVIVLEVTRSKRKAQPHQARRARTPRLIILGFNPYREPRPVTKPRQVVKAPFGTESATGNRFNSAILFEMVAAGKKPQIV